MLAAGMVQVESTTGRFVFRRKCRHNQSYGLTISATDATPIDEQTIPALLAHLPPTLVSRLYAIDFAQVPNIDWLLDESLTRHLKDLKGQDLKASAEDPGPHEGLSPDNANFRQPSWVQLKAEIGRCRHMLRDLEARTASLRVELAQLHPDGAADQITSLANGRTTLGVLECFADDLDAEISQLARDNHSSRCVGHETHTRLAPIAKMIRRQIHTLCGQLAEQERTVRREWITTELRQHSRTQTDLGEQLEQLLSHREALIRTSQTTRRSAMQLPQATVADYCQYEHQGPFLLGADAESRAWRASDILAQLTEGRLVQIRLQPRESAHHLQHEKHADRRLVLIDRDSRLRKSDSLTGAEQDQLTLALALALVAAYARQGVELPLMLNEPFFRQDQAATTAMAGVLHQFAHAGQQLLVFTKNRYALQRFQSLRSPIHQLDTMPRQAHAGLPQGGPGHPGIPTWSRNTPAKATVPPATTPAQIDTPKETPQDKDSGLL